MRHAIVLLMSLILYGLVPWLQGCSPSQHPKIVVPNWDFQFAEPLVVGSEITTTFTFINEGNAPLRIMSIDADCGCVATNLSTSDIPPGGSGTIRVNVDQDVGRFRQNVYVQTNDPITSVVNLQVSGTILPVVTFPKQMDLGQLEKGEHVTRTIELTNNLEQPLEITKNMVSGGRLTAAFPERQIPAGGRLTFHVGVSTSEVGRYSESLTLSAQTQETLPGTDSNTFEMAIQFEGRVLGGIVVLPQNLFLGVLDSSGKSVQKKVHIKTDGSFPFALKKVSAENFKVTAELGPEPRKVHDVVLSIAPKGDNASSGLVEGTIRIATDHPDVPEIAIPVKAVKP